MLTNSTKVRAASCRGTEECGNGRERSRRSHGAASSDMSDTSALRRVITTRGYRQVTPDEDDEPETREEYITGDDPRPHG